MKFWLQWILCFFLFFVTAEKGSTIISQTEADEAWAPRAELQLAKLHFTSSDKYAKAQGTLTPHSNRAKFHMDRPGSSLNGAYAASRPAPVNHLPNLPASKTLQEMIDQLHQSTHRDYVLSHHYSAGLPPLPVCTYYVFALRHILI